MQQSTKSQQGWDTGRIHSAGVQRGGKSGEEEERSHAEMLLNARNAAVWTQPDGGRKMLSRNFHLNEMPCLKTFYSLL